MPSYGRDPWRWLDAALAVARGYGYEVLFPTQEQVTVLARAADRVAQAWVATAVPSFEALVRVQDKVSAAATLAKAGLPTPVTTVARDLDSLRAVTQFPVFLKAPIGIASTAVHRVGDQTGLYAATPSRPRRVRRRGDSRPEAIEGQLMMIQSVFDHGRNVASTLICDVARGQGRSVVQSIDLPVIRDHLQRNNRARLRPSSSE
jgi:biotin carboxylase